MLTCHGETVMVAVASGLPLALWRLQPEVDVGLGVVRGGSTAAIFLVATTAAAAVGGGRAAAALLVVVALAGLVVLEPVEDVLALHLAEGAEVGGDALDLLRAGRAQPRAEELRQDLHLLRRRVPPPALDAYPPAQRLHDRRRSITSLPIDRYIDRSYTTLHYTPKWIGFASAIYILVVCERSMKRMQEAAC